MRSTHAYTPSFATFLPNIHVGCCLFSHNPKKPNKKKKSDVQIAFVTFLFGSIIICTVVQLKEKKMRSTHACTPSFAHLSSQYSRQLLSILARQQYKKQQPKRFVCQSLFNLLFVGSVIIF